MKNLFYFLRVLRPQRFTVGCVFVLLSSLSLQAQTDWNQVIKTASSTRAVKSSAARAASDHFGYAVAVDGNYAAVGAPGEDEDAAGGNTLSDAGSVLVFEKIAGTWTQIKKLVAADRAEDDYFGYSVAISGMTVVVGANQEDEDAAGANPLVAAGSVYIFNRDQGGPNNWGQVKKLVAADRAAGDQFGYSVAISGTMVMVGANVEDEDATGANTLVAAGSAYVFSQEQGGPNNWGQVKKLVAADRAADDRFGHSVAISGTTLVVGAFLEDEDAAGLNTVSNAGSVYIFNRDQGGPNNWGQVRKIVAADRAAGDYFGSSVAISGTTVVVGAFLENEDAAGANTLVGAGSAYVFSRDEGGSNNWGQVKKLVATDRAANDNFGISVAISGTMVVVGAIFEDEDAAGANTLGGAGSAYVFSQDQGGPNNWGQVKKLVAADRAANDNFGISVAISGTTVVVGAYQEDEDAAGLNTVSTAGSAYVFSQDQGGSNNWGQVQKIVLEDVIPNQYYGFRVEIDGNYAVVGASQDPTDATGGAGLVDAGAVYILQKNGGVWQEVKKLVAADRAANDQFGTSVAISGTTVVVGAPYEDEDAAGANTLNFAGSAYVFSRDQGGPNNWGQVKKLVASDRAAGDAFGLSVAISGTTVVVGASQESEDAAGMNTFFAAGSAYVFSQDQGGPNNWGQVKKLVAQDRAESSSFGISVVISGTTIVVGASKERKDALGENSLGDAGSAYVFSQDQGGPNNWGQVKKLVAADRAGGDVFGLSVAISGTTVVVGANQEDEDAAGANTLNFAGSAYVFNRDQGGPNNWGQVKKLVAQDRAANDRFGLRVAISGTTVVVGANQEDEDVAGANTLSDAGSAYVFNRDQGGPNNWGQVKKLVAQDRAVDDRFGRSVAISGTTIVAGAPLEDEDAAGLNTVSNAGSAYFFEGTTPSPDYTITTTGNVLTITDVSGNGETLAISQSGSNIRFNVTGRTYAINGGTTTAFTTPADVALSGITSIVVNTATGNDIVNVGAFTTQLPSLTINGGTGDDQVNMNGDITFVANANLDLDLQNDDANPGNDILIFSNDANILLSGTGTATLKASQSIYFGSGSSLVTTNGTMLIEANQQSTSTAGNFKGVEVSGTLSTTGGGITIKGKGGNDASNFQTGVRINGPLLATSGNITIEGTGGAGTANDNYGIEVSSTGTVGTGNGGILLTGMGGGSGASQNNEGVRVRGAISSTRNSPSSTSITLLGTGGNTIGSGNNGVSIADGSLFTNSPILITGIAGNSTADDITILSGTINASASSARTITLSGDKVNIGIGAIIGNNATSIVALIQRTDNTPINLGTETAGSLSYTSEEMNRIFADEIYIGNATSGPMTISATIAPANISATCRITLQTSLDLIMSGGGIATLGGNVRLRSPQIYPNFSGADISMGTGILTFDPPGRRVNIVIDGPIANTNYTQLNVIGVINIFATNLSITGSYTPTAGETFTIINNDGTDLIQNGFNNVTEGGIFNNFLGSGLRGKVTYVGGDGNDVVITVLAPDYTITTTDGTIVITDLTGTGETMDISQNSGNIRFNVSGKTYRIDNDVTMAFTTPAQVSLSNKTGIIVNTGVGDDIINVGAFTALPSLTINGGTGDDQVNLNGDITFVANANLDLDLQNDDANAGVDALTIATNANLNLSGTGIATVKVSKNITMNAGSSLVTQNGNIGLITNSIDIQSGATVSTSTASSITLRPYTDGVAVDLGAVTDPVGGPLNLTDAELDRITTGTIHVGNANSGAITVSAAISRTANTAMNLISGGAINLNASSLNLNGGNLSINAAGGINPTAAGDDINVGTASVTSGNDLNIVINGPTVDTDYRQLKIGGSMSLNGVDLVLTTSNGFVPTIGQTFTIVQRNNLPGAITGRFNGLEYGALITNFLGSGLNAYITYAQTTVVLTVIANTPDYTITTANGQIIITDVAGNGDGLEVTENGTNIHIENYTLGRTFSLNGAPVAAFPADIPLSGTTGITINARNGNDYIFISDFTQLLPSLTVNGDAGNDIVVLGNVHFMPDAHLNVDLQNDLGGAGEDEISINASVVLSGSGTAVLKASAGVYLSNLTTENGDIVIEVNQQSVPLPTATGFYMQRGKVEITGTGALTIKATQGQIDGPAIQTFSPSAFSTNSGNLTIEGYAGTGTGNGNRGIETKAQISSVNGNIFIKGVGGGSGSSTDNQGIFFNNIVTGDIKTTGSGSITLVGTGGNSTGSDNEGIHIGIPFIESAAGDVSLTGYSNANSTPVALNNTPVRTLSAGKTIQINADDISYASTISTTGANSSVTLKPTTAGRAVTLGTDVPNTLNLSSAELGAINTYRLNIGDANTGAITNNAAQTLSAISNSVALTTGGALNLNASSFGIGSANLLINAAGGINPTVAGTDVNVGTVSFASGNDLAISINGTTADTDYRQLNVAGSVNLSGLDLVLSGSHVPVLGQTFVIINNDGSDAIQGTFNGLPEGATIPSFLGSQLTARISYLGGDGNDVSITLEVFTATISGTRVVCQNTPFPQITFTATGGTIPYTFTYKINGGANQTITTVSGNSVSISQTTAMMGVFTYTLVSVRDGSSTQSNQIQTSTATITVHASAELSYTGANPACQWYTSKLWANTPGTWTANDPTKATIAEDGTVSALLAGQATFTFTMSATGCQTISSPLTIKPTPVSALIASKNEVCPNEVVSLDARCSIPTSTVNWNPGGPTVTPAAATLPYIYKARCEADGCVGNETSVEVRTHRILVDMKDLDVGALPLPIVRSVKDNMAPTNLIQAPVFPRRWTFIANGCDASESAEFKLSGPVLFNAIDNAGTYAMFANEGNSFYSIDHPNYGNGGSFPDGTYTLTINLRSKDGVGGPYPKNRVATGALLATRTLQFTVVGPSHGSPQSVVGGRQSVVGSEQWVVSSGQFAEVAPNPVFNTMRLKINESKGQNVGVSLIDASGRMMLQRSFVPETNQHQEEFEVSQLTSGMYFLRVNTENKNATLKLVKVE